MNEVERLRVINKLKSIYRFASLGDRKESSAEHSWSSLIIADFFLLKVKDVNRLRVYELLMYHDLVEIEAGDFPIGPGKEYPDKKEKEYEAAQILKEKLPLSLKDRFFDLFMEFEKLETREAKFAKLIDFLDSDMHELDYKEDWKGWTKEYYLSRREEVFSYFPELGEFFKDFVKYLEENGYFSVN